MDGYEDWEVWAILERGRIIQNIFVDDGNRMKSGLFIMRVLMESMRFTFTGWHITSASSRPGPRNKAECVLSCHSAEPGRLPVFKG